eukprot:scaffold38032_cov183-Amphora_coffeaeformis.AAC.3
MAMQSAAVGCCSCPVVAIASAWAFVEFVAFPSSKRIVPWTWSVPNHVLLPTEYDSVQFFDSDFEPVCDAISFAVVGVVIVRLALVAIVAAALGVPWLPHGPWQPQDEDRNLWGF